MKSTISISAGIYGVLYAVRSSHISHVTTPLLQRGLLKKVTAISPAISGKIPAITRESQRADHAVIEARITPTANESSTGIYTLTDRQETISDNEEKREEKKDIHN